MMQQKPKPIATGLHNPNRMTNNAPSKGKSTNSKGGGINSKGGNTNSKGDQITEVHCTQTVTATQHEDRRNLPIATNPPVPRQIVQAPATQSKSQYSVSLPNYIFQDEDNNQAPIRQPTRLAAKSIMQEAMLSCVDIYKPH